MGLLAFTSSSRSEGTSLGLGHREPPWSTTILFMIFHLRSAALSLSLHALVTGGPWYSIAGGGGDDMSPLICCSGSLSWHVCRTSAISSCDSNCLLRILEHWATSCFDVSEDAGFLHVAPLAGLNSVVAFQQFPILFSFESMSGPCPCSSSPLISWTWFPNN